MNSKLLKHLAFITLSLNTFFCFSQKEPKFGDINKEDIYNNVCPIDSNANAYYIFDYGKSTFEYASTTIRVDEPASSRKGFQINFERHFRIKVINNNGLEWSSILCRRKR